MLDFKRLRTDLLALVILAGCVFIALAARQLRPSRPPPARRSSPLMSSSRTFAVQQVPHWPMLQLALGHAAWLVLVALVAFDLRLFSATRPRFRAAADGLADARPRGLFVLQLLAPTIGTGPVVGSGGYLGMGEKSC
ncbi:MAG: hypothetical protein R3B90_23635 [Planctomycetaceae bacterium]